MSFFGDIADAVGGAADWVSHAAEDAAGAAEGLAKDVLTSGVGQVALGLGGSLFGDPGLGGQVKAGFNVLDSIFGKGSSAGRTMKAATRPRSFAVSTRTLAPSGRVSIAFRGKRFSLTRAQAAKLAALVRKRRGILARPDPVSIASPPPPPPPVPTINSTPVVRAILASPDAIKDAVDAGQTIKIGNVTIDPKKDVIFVPAGLADDVAATGLQVRSPEPPDDSSGPGGRYHDDF